MAKTEQTGLYDATNEHDACGVGMVVNIHGNKSHELVDSALKVLENMRHRGAEGADNKTGDGAGIMLQIPPRIHPPARHPRTRKRKIRNRTRISAQRRKRASQHPEHYD